MLLQTKSDTGLIKYEGETAYIDLHKYQARALKSDARFIFILAGTQGGKTSFLPWWLNQEIDRTADPGGENDYLAVTSSYDLFKLKFLPEMKRVFEELIKRGRYWAGLKVIELCDPDGKFWAKNADDIMWGRIILRSAQSEGGLESTSAKAAILDECGQDEFRIDSWEAVQRRLSLFQGRVCAGTTLYNRGWIMTEIYDRWKAGDKNYEVIQFPSFANPSFPKEEYDRIASILPKWKVNMFYRGEYDIPEGLIYSSFDNSKHTIAPFPIPDEWDRYAGHDFGGVNMAGLLYAENPNTSQLFLIDEYLEGHKTTKQHAETFKEWSPKQANGGSWSEDQERLEFGSHGYPIMKPSIKSVEVGIDRVYAQHSIGGIIAFKSCIKYIDEKGTYSRELDRDGNPTEKIKDKSKFHLMDCERYIIGTIRAEAMEFKVRRLVG